MAVDISRIGSRLDILYLVTREFSAAANLNKALQNVLSAFIASVRASDACLFLLDANGYIEDRLLISGFEAQKQGHPILKIRL